MKKSLWMSGLCVAALGTLSVVGCSGGGGTPGEPTPDPTVGPTPLATSTPAPPTELTVEIIQHPTEGTVAQLRWRDNADNEFGYIVEQNASGNGWKSDSWERNATLAAVTRLPPDTGYRFRVRAFNNLGESDASNEVTARTPALAQANHSPAPPYSPRYVSQFQGSDRVIWSSRNVTYSVSVGSETREAALLNGAIDRAFARWASGTNGLLTFTRVESGANIPITFVPEGDPTLTDGAGSASYTLQPGSPRATFLSTSIKLQAGLSEGLLVAVATHEIGHALGITGHSDSANDAMAAIVNPAFPVSARDANTLAFLYLTNDAN